MLSNRSWAKDRPRGKGDQNSVSVCAQASLSRTILEQIDPLHLVPGGVDTCIHDLVKYAVEHEIRIAGVTANPDTKLGEWQRLSFAGREISFLPVERLDREVTSGFASRIPHSLRLAVGAWRFRKQIGNGTIQTHRIELGFIAQQILGAASHVQFIHNDGNGLTGSNSDSYWKRLPLLYRYLERTVLKRAASVVLFNKTDAARIRTIRPATTVTSTWYDPDLYFAATEAPTDPQGPLSVCWVGRLEEQKDPLLAIETFAIVARASERASLTMIGAGRLEGSVRERLERLGLADRVRLTGALPRVDVAEAMRTHHVMLMTSHYEGSPRVMAEALACGMPVIATAGADTDKILVAGQNGERVNSRTPDELATSILNHKADSLCCVASVAARAAPAAVKRLLEL